MTIGEVRAVIEQYEKHGWKLRRFIASPSMSGVAGEIIAQSTDVLLVEHNNSALWFSRRSNPENESWELRRLSSSAYALVEVLDDEWSHDAKEELLTQTQDRMFSGQPHRGN